MTNDDKIPDRTEAAQAAKAQLDSLDEIEAFGREYFATEFPNSPRTGCPPRDVLREYARVSRLPDDELHGHLFSCSDCFLEFRRVVAAAEDGPEPWWRRFFLISGGIQRPALAALAALVVVVIAAVWLLSDRKETHRSETRIEAQTNVSDQARKTQAGRDVPEATPNSAPAANQTGRSDASPAEMPGVMTARIDLRNYPSLGSRERDAGVAGEGARPIRVAIARTRLSLRLPEGSASGGYTISILDRSTLKPVISVQGSSATGRNLDATLNLETLAPAEYVLRLAHPGEAPSDYSLVAYRK